MRYRGKRIYQAVALAQKAWILLVLLHSVKSRVAQGDYFRTFTAVGGFEWLSRHRLNSS